MQRKVAHRNRVTIPFAQIFKADHPRPIGQIAGQGNHDTPDPTEQAKTRSSTTGSPSPTAARKSVRILPLTRLRQPRGPCQRLRFIRIIKKFNQLVFNEMRKIPQCVGDGGEETGEAWVGVAAIRVPKKDSPANDTQGATKRGKASKVT